MSNLIPWARRKRYWKGKKGPRKVKGKMRERNGAGLQRMTELEKTVRCGDYD